MVGQGRENKEDNDLFYTCALIEYISRKTYNKRVDVVNKLGKDRINKIYDWMKDAGTYRRYRYGGKISKNFKRDV